MAANIGRFRHDPLAPLSWRNIRSDAAAARQSHAAVRIVAAMSSAADTVIAPWDSDHPKGCAMPKRMHAIEAQLYERIRTLHCDRNAASHDCSGRVTLDRNGMTLQCPLCGDCRTVYPRDEAAR
jgi:hypothetical protein